MSQDMIDGTRMIVDITGALHEFQVTQLKRWPLVALDGVERCEVRITIGDARQEVDDQGNARRKHRPIAVEYLAYTDGKEHTDEMLTKWRKGSEALKSWTQQLLWPDTEVAILVDSYRIEFESTPEITI